MVVTSLGISEMDLVEVSVLYAVFSLPQRGATGPVPHLETACAPLLTWAVLLLPF